MTNKFIALYASYFMLSHPHQNHSFYMKDLSIYDLQAISPARLSDVAVRIQGYLNLQLDKDQIKIILKDENATAQEFDAAWQATTG